MSRRAHPTCRERMNPPQQPRKASQTAGGFTCTRSPPAEAPPPRGSG
ncbi:MAG: hypothetical protein AVDCRST_MAG89-2298 [uncultured Gemmatimonadetes bacterium]|uniref:Uncharacterized protein n=1 Tax=uncultured Gemmatimonadota bacterium TaxID=203437 RepID=A0A6J4LK83_9BACT|nr:MAG: hypothetical protein AVDCRST_MAG89-2298 [uncultured Gemmatimonadota bacterium]